MPTWVTSCAAGRLRPTRRHGSKESCLRGRTSSLFSVRFAGAPRAACASSRAKVHLGPISSEWRQRKPKRAFAFQSAPRHRACAIESNCAQAAPARARPLRRLSCGSALEIEAITSLKGASPTWKVEGERLDLKPPPDSGEMSSRIRSPPEPAAWGQAAPPSNRRLQHDEVRRRLWFNMAAELHSVCAADAEASEGIPVAQCILLSDPAPEAHQYALTALVRYTKKTCPHQPKLAMMPSFALRRIVRVWFAFAVCLTPG